MIVVFLDSPLQITFPRIVLNFESRCCVFGFCQAFVPQRSLPGWHEGSWAYHGDDGALYVEEAWHTSRESDQAFDVGDVIGCGMNFETGKGYRTKNGVLLDSCKFIS